MLTIDRRVDGRSARRLTDYVGPWRRRWRRVRRRHAITAPPAEPTEIWPPDRLGDIAEVDPLLCALDGSTYDLARVEHQLRYLSDTADHQEQLATRLTLVTVGFGGAAAFGLAASWGPGHWPGLVAACATALLAALITWREHLQRDAMAEAYRTTVAVVSAVRARWLAVPSSTR